MVYHIFYILLGRISVGIQIKRPRFLLMRLNTKFPFLLDVSTIQLMIHKSDK